MSGVIFFYNEFEIPVSKLLNLIKNVGDEHAYFFCSTNF